MQAFCRRAACVCTHSLAIKTGASRAGTLRLPVWAFFIFHPLQHTDYNKKWKKGVMHFFKSITYLWEHVCVFNSAHLCVIAFADWTTKMRVYNWVGTLNRRTFLLMADNSPSLQQKEIYTNHHFRVFRFIGPFQKQQIHTGNTNKQIFILFGKGFSCFK